MKNSNYFKSALQQQSLGLRFFTNELILWKISKAKEHEELIRCNPGIIPPLTPHPHRPPHPETPFPVPPCTTTIINVLFPERKKFNIKQFAFLVLVSRFGLVVKR